MKKPQRRARKKGEDLWVSIHLTGKSDPDLIAWWDGTPEGDGSKLIKQAIREKHLAAQGPSEIELLRQEIRALMKLIGAGGHISPSLQEDGESQLDPEIAAARREQLRKAKW